MLGIAGISVNHQRPGSYLGTSSLDDLQGPSHLPTDHYPFISLIPKEKIFQN